MLIGTPFHLIAWLLGGVGPGVGISVVVLIMAIFVARGEIHQIDACPYTRWGQYPELVRH